MTGGQRWPSPDITTPAHPGTGGSLAMLAHAFLTVITAAERAARPTPDRLVPITVNELRRLFDALLLRPNLTLERLQQ